MYLPSWGAMRAQKFYSAVSFGARLHLPEYRHPQTAVHAPMYPRGHMCIHSPTMHAHKHQSDSMWQRVLMPARDYEEAEVPGAGEAQRVFRSGRSYQMSSGKERREPVPAAGPASPSLASHLCLFPHPTPGLLPIQALSIRSSTSPMTMRSAACSPVTPIRLTSRPSRVTRVSALMPWMSTSKPAVSIGPTGTRAPSPTAACHLPHLPPLPTATGDRLTEVSPTSM